MHACMHAARPRAAIIMIMISYRHDMHDAIATLPLPVDVGAGIEMRPASCSTLHERKLLSSAQHPRGQACKPRHVQPERLRRGPRLHLS